MIKFKKTTAALLVAGLTVAGSSYAWANEAIFKPADAQKDVSASAEKDFVVTMYPPNNESEETSNKKNTTSPESLVEGSTEDDTKVKVAKYVNKESKEENVNATKDNEASENEFPEIPEGYTAGNLVALKQAYENAGSENAKQAILKNAHKAIAKFEGKQGSKEVEKKAEIKVELEYIGVINSGETMITPVQKETLKNTEQPTVVPSTETKTDNQLSTKEQQKAEKKALKEKHKEEKKALKAEHKAEKKNGKDKE